MKSKILLKLLTLALIFPVLANVSCINHQEENKRLATEKLESANVSSFNCHRNRTEKIKVVSNSVVSIALRHNNDNRIDRAAFGTGFFVRENLIVTAFHVHRDISEAIENYGKNSAHPVAVKQSQQSGQKFVVPLTLVTVDEKNDLAIYSFSPAAIKEQWGGFEIKPLPLAERPPEIGEEVFSTGFHADYKFPFTSIGNVAMIDEKGAIYSDLTLMPSNSGSPLCSLETGEVIGANVLVIVVNEFKPRMGIAANSLQIKQLLASTKSDEFRK